MHPWWRWIGIAILFSVLWSLLCLLCSAQDRLVDPPTGRVFPPCVLHDKNGLPTQNPCGADKHPVITYTIPAAAMPRADDEVKLIRMLHQDLAETQAGLLNIELRRKMVTLMLKIQKEDQTRP